MDQLLEQSLLYDFYGEMLTDHQKTAFEGYVFENLSLGELASELGISRQGVHDLIKRSETTLRDYEEKLHMVSRFSKAKDAIERIHNLTVTDTDETEIVDMSSRLSQIRSLADHLLEEL